MAILNLLDFRGGTMLLVHSIYFIALLCSVPSGSVMDWSFQITWGDGNTTVYSYPKSVYSDCVYNSTDLKLTCMHDHDFHEIMSRWAHDPELIEYVSLRCLAQSDYSENPNVCFCKDTKPSEKSNSINKESSIQGSGSMPLRDVPSFACQLDHVSQELFQGLSALELLDLSDNRITRVHPESFLNLQSLRVLSLAGNPLALPPNITVCLPPNLEVLDLSRLAASGFPDAFFQKCNKSPSSPSVALTSPDSRHLSLSYVDMSETRLSELPVNAFWNLGNVRLVNLSHASLHAMAANPFIGAFRLQTLDLSSNHMTEVIASFCEGMPLLRRLDFSKNSLSGLNLTVLSLCESLSIVDVSSNIISNLTGLPLEMNHFSALNLSRNHLQELREPLFKGASKIKVLDLSLNDLKLIHSDVLEYASKMEWLDLRNNALNESGVNLKNLTFHCPRLLHLDLSHNLLTYLEKEFLSDLHLLTFLNLGSNHISDVHVESFEGLMALRVLDLSNNFIVSLDPQTFSSLAKLSHLDLSQNTLTRMSQVGLPPSLISLDLSRNQYTNVPVLNDSHVQSVCLAWNAIESVSEAHLFSLQDAVDLDLSHNIISSIGTASFHHLQRLEKLDLAYNQIRSLDADIVSTLSRLEHLDISHNLLTSVAGIELPTSLQNLDASINKIEMITTPINFKNTTTLRLRSLSFRGCGITFIAPHVFQNLIYLRDVDLRDNKMALVSRFNAHPGVTFGLQNNPIMCSCHMTWLKSLEKGHHKASTVEFVVNTCITPPRYDVLPVTEVPVEKFMCRVYAACPRFCRCFATETNTRPEIVMCNQQNMTSVPFDLPNEAKVISLEGNRFERLESVSSEPLLVEELYFNSSSIENINETAFEHTASLQVLDLSKNFLSSLHPNTFNTLTNLTRLNLRDNFISILPENVFKELDQFQYLDLSFNELNTIDDTVITTLKSMSYLKELYLGNNPWSCSCENIGFVRWTVQQGRIRDKIYTSGANWQYAKKNGNEDDESHVFDNDGSYQDEEIKWIIRDVDKMMCQVDSDNDNHLIVLFDIATLECDGSGGPSKTAILAICVVAVLLLCLASLCFYHRHILAALFYTRMGGVGLKRPAHLSRKLRFSGVYDITVLYDVGDRKLRWWVDSVLVPRLEHPRWGFTVKCPTEESGDGRGRGSHMDVSLHHVKQSRSSLVLLSPGFGNNRECVKCLHQALQQTRSGLHTVVLVTWGELTRETLDCGVRLMINRGMYLPITSRLFWDRLLYKLPLPRHLMESRWLVTDRKGVGKEEGVVAEEGHL